MYIKSIASGCLIATVTAIQLESQVITEEHAIHAAQISAGKTWTNNDIYWCRAKVTDEFRTNAFLRGIEQYGKALPGCIKFIEIPEKGGKCDPPAAAESSIYFSTQYGGCWSHQGMYSKNHFQQRLNIGNGCTSIGTILHEIAHSLGQAHEQCRSDRDESVFIDFKNIQAMREGNFAKEQKSYTVMPYDYSSIMQYGAFDFAKDHSKPVIKPINCEPNCPPLSALGARTGFTLLDQRQAADMYHCTKQQQAIRTETVECIDWLTFNKAPLDCAAYKAAGKCTTNSKPCCNCNKWYSGLRQRKWITSKPVAECKDSVQSTVCNELKDLKMCWSGFVKQKCEKTCEVCTKADGQDYNDDMTGREVYSMPGGKNYVGQVSRVQNALSLGVYTWGNLVRHIGTFKNQFHVRFDKQNYWNKQPSSTMYRANPDGSMYHGAIKNWLNVSGRYFPPLSVSKNAVIQGNVLADGTMSAGTITWDDKYVYSGNLSRGLATGSSETFTWDGNTYTGAWTGGKPHGQGVITFKAGEKFTAQWSNGQGSGKICKDTACANWTFRLF